MKARPIDMAEPLRVKSKFFFSKKSNFIQIINVAEDDSIVFRLSGTCAEVFSLISTNQSLEEIKQLLLQKPEYESTDPKQLENFLSDFVQDMLSQGILER